MEPVPRTRHTMSVYDVIYIDGHGEEQIVAEHLDDREEAGGIARAEAARRGVGRMMLTGSTKPLSCVCVIPVDAGANGGVPARPPAVDGDGNGRVPRAGDA